MNIPDNSGLNKPKGSKRVPGFTFWAFVRKEFYHIFRDRRTLLILMGMPIVQIILFGFAISTEVKNIQVAVLDPTPSEVTRQLVQRIDASEYFDVQEVLSSPGEIDKVFRKRTADLVIAFSSGFSDHLYQADGSQILLIPDGSDINTATTIEMYMNNIIRSYLLEQVPGRSPAGLDANLHLLYNPQMKSSYNFVPGVMGLILMLICAMMTSVSIVREKEIGTMEVLLVSPVKPIFIILSKMIPYLVLSVFNLTTILVLSVYVLDVPIAGSIWAIFGISLVYIIVSLALGLLISTFTNSQMAAMLISGAVLMMPVILLSGMIFPIDSMPLPLQNFSHIIPAKWYIAAIRKLMIQGLPVQFVAKEFAILGGMALLLIGISLKNFKNRLG